MHFNMYGCTGMGSLVSKAGKALKIKREGGLGTRTGSSDRPHAQHSLNIRTPKQLIFWLCTPGVEPLYTVESS